MSCWNDAQRASRAQRTLDAKGRVLMAIMALHGGGSPRCLSPGCNEVEGLAVDHPHGRTWDVRKPNSEVRWRLYEQELKDGMVLGLLCQHHSGHDGRMRFQGRPKWRGLARAQAAKMDFWEWLAAGGDSQRAPDALTNAERMRLGEYLYG